MADVAKEMRDVPIESLHEVRARFSDADAMERAVASLEMSGFDRADLSLPEVAPSRAEDTPEAGARPVDTEADVRQARTLQTSAAASLAGMAAAGVVIATGGAAAPAVAAAAAGGGTVIRRPRPAVAFDGRLIAWVVTKEKLLIEYLERNPVTTT